MNLPDTKRKQLVAVILAVMVLGIGLIGAALYMMYGPTGGGGFGGGGGIGSDKTLELPFVQIQDLDELAQEIRTGLTNNPEDIQKLINYPYIFTVTLPEWYLNKILKDDPGLLEYSAQARQEQAEQFNLSIKSAETPVTKTSDCSEMYEDLSGSGLMGSKVDARILDAAGRAMGFNKCGTISVSYNAQDGNSTLVFTVAHSTRLETWSILDATQQ